MDTDPGIPGSEFYEPIRLPSVPINKKKDGEKISLVTRLRQNTGQLGGREGSQLLEPRAV